MLSATVIARVAPLTIAAVVALGYEIARPGYEYDFPRDHFEHPGFAMEWWYYTGNLADGEGRKFGYELTFFRAAVGGEEIAQTNWDLNQIYIAHFVVTDVQGQRLIHRERANRSGPGLAGASAATGTIWNGNWSVEYKQDATPKPIQRLRAGDESAALELSLEPTKGPVLHGEEGISRKGGEAGQASHYISFTRMQTTGSLTIAGSVHQVQGLSWMDHEFFSENMATGLAGWDWLSIQLDDQTDLMIAGIRLSNGRYSPYSHGTLVHPDGRIMRLTAEDIRLTPGRIWQSGETGAKYPVEWTLQIPAAELRLEVRPLHDAQEIVSRAARMPTYWEGPVSYSGSRAGTPVTGSGYLEMTGYDRKLELSVE
jgi:predicted secreted hydrolase